MILIALLVILVPEWLDGAGHKSRYPGHIEIPATPEIQPMQELMPAAPAQTAEQAPAETDDVAEAPAAEEPVAKPARSHSSLHAWALQVGSFTEESNARVLRDRMRAKGYAAYIDEQKSASNMHYRVRIGPELDRSRVDKLRETIQQKEKIKGMVVNHP